VGPGLGLLLRRVLRATGIVIPQLVTKREKGNLDENTVSAA